MARSSMRKDLDCRWRSSSRAVVEVLKKLKYLKTISVPTSVSVLVIKSARRRRGRVVNEMPRAVRKSIVESPKSRGTNAGFQRA
jgi:hypothetical protein